MKSLRGTMSYMAPEQIPKHDGKSAYNKTVDTYSFGLTCLALLDYSKGNAMRVFGGK